MNYLVLLTLLLTLTACGDKRTILQNKQGSIVYCRSEPIDFFASYRDCIEEANARGFW